MVDKGFEPFSTDFSVALLTGFNTDKPPEGAIKLTDLIVGQKTNQTFHLQHVVRFCIPTVSGDGFEPPPTVLTTALCFSKLLLKNHPKVPLSYPDIAVRDGFEPPTF